MEEQNADVNELEAKFQQHFINSGTQYGYGSNSQYSQFQPTYLPGSVQPIFENRGIQNGAGSNSQYLGGYQPWISREGIVLYS